MSYNSHDAECFVITCSASHFLKHNVHRFFYILIAGVPVRTEAQHHFRMERSKPVFMPGGSSADIVSELFDQNLVILAAHVVRVVMHTVLFLLSGGGSALFEMPLIPGEELQDITKQLLASGADIVEMNTIRKRLSGVKGGRFAKRCMPAHVFSIVLSDILGDPLDMIASGPAYPDTSTCEAAAAIVEKYSLKLSEKAQELLKEETPKELTNVTTQITGSVRELCAAAAVKCGELGYKPIILTDQLCSIAREAGSFLASILKTHAGDVPREKLAYIAGGETVVQLTGKGLGGRNQELALAACTGIAGIPNAAVFSFGSDGTDGPTDAAGGYVDEDTLGELTAAGLDVFAVLKDNDAYHALKAVDGLIMTGPTGTNVNDVAVALLG